MKNLLSITLLLVIGILTFSCMSQRDKDAKAITNLEKELEKEAARPDQQKLTKLLDSYIGFADNHADDSTSQEYLYKAVNLCIGTNQGDKAMELINRSFKDYPKSKYHPTMVFLEAYVLENLLSDYGRASRVYNEFLKKYPDHDLADDAEAALKYLGKSPEEMVKEFEAAGTIPRVNPGN